MKTWLLSSVMVVVLLGGCAARKPLVDMKGVDPVQYEADLADCQKYAAQVGGAGAGAAGGALIGGAIGYGLGRAVGANDPSAAGRGGAVLGGASGAGKGARNRQEVVSKCLTGRGYKVLN
jgi:outer membrane lipoprotein SlyB